MAENARSPVPSHRHGRHRPRRPRGPRTRTASLGVRLPQRYLLAYATPVPRYRAPEDITAVTAVTAVTAEIVSTLLGTCAAASADTAEAARRPFSGTRRPHRQVGLRPRPVVRSRTEQPAGRLPSSWRKTAGRTTHLGADVTPRVAPVLHAHAEPDSATADARERSKAAVSTGEPGIAR